MPRESKYGTMPPVPAYTAKIKGDAGTYKVWGFGWLNHRVLVDRAGLVWLAIDKVALEPVNIGEGERQD